MSRWAGGGGTSSVTKKISILFQPTVKGAFTHGLSQLLCQAQMSKVMPQELGKR